ncbi:MAG: rRNA methyltransferase [Parachlamydiales bacterium]|nr:rRNA methyltransferase [Parachlamydiales bacterium]
MDKITSLQNAKVKQAVRLRDRRERDETDLFLIEGYRELKRAIDARRSIQSIYFCPELFLGDNEQQLMEKSQAELIGCTPEVFAKISYRDRPDGLLGVALQKHLNIGNLDEFLSNNPFLVMAESIEKPGNLGTILRSSDAAGVDAVIVCDPTTDIHNPNVVRSSVGTLFTQPVIEADGQEMLALLRRRSIAIVAATPHAAKSYTDADFSRPVAIAVGTEQYGLSDEWMKMADCQVRIPMLGVADSLNVASATTLLLYEVLRQRGLLR